MSRSRAVLRGVYPHDCIQSTEADIERRVRHELNDLGLGEVTSQLGPERVIDLVVVDGELLDEPDGRTFPLAQQV